MCLGQKKLLTRTTQTAHSLKEKFGVMLPCKPRVHQNVYASYDDCHLTFRFQVRSAKRRCEYVFHVRRRGQWTTTTTTWWVQEGFFSFQAWNQWIKKKMGHSPNMICSWPQCCSQDHLNQDQLQSVSKPRQDRDRGGASPTLHDTLTIKRVACEP